MLAEYGTLSLADVLAPAITLADGYPIEAETRGRDRAEKAKLAQWPALEAVLLPHAGEKREAPRRRPARSSASPISLATPAQARRGGGSRALAARQGSPQGAIMAAYERFYRGDIGAEFVRGAREPGRA